MPSRLCVWGLAALVFVGVTPAPISAQYLQRFESLTNGAVTFTGNTLGLDAENNQNGQGTRGAIGTFITTDTTLRDTTPAPGSAPLFPFGTTSDWQLNRSEAQLRLPPGARVLRAELVWGGTFAGTAAADNVSAFLNNPIRFTTPAGAFDVAPDPATARSAGTPAGTGTCNGCFYVRSADVTGLVAASGAGTYATGRVPATQGTTDNNNPVAGWTLAVVYEDFTQPIRNLTLFLGLEPSGGAAAQVSGFCTPPAGPLNGRLAVTALEGDARITGDKFLFGPATPLTDINRVSGQRNPLNNFFAGQIVDNEGNLDISGTFGDRNHTAGTPVAGGRQGWDITNVSVAGQLLNNQTTAFAQGTTTGDGYRIAALALQIDVGAPRFASGDALSVDRLAAQLGDVLTYTVRLANSGDAAASNVVFFDTLAAGTSFVPGSFTLNGAAQPGADPVAGVPLGAIGAGAIVTVTFQAQVTSIPAGPNPNVRANRARWTFDFVSCAGQPVQLGANETNTVVTDVPVADLAIAKTLLNPPPVAGTVVQYQVVATNNGPSTVNGALVSDPGSSPALTGVTWSCVASFGSACPPAGTGSLSASVLLGPSGSATFTVSGTLPSDAPAGTDVSNTATVTAPADVPDFNLANNTASAAETIAASADVRLTKSGPATGQRGNTVTYTVTVINGGPSDAQNVLVTDPVPAGLTPVSITGACAVVPGCALAAGESQMVEVVFGIPPGYAGADPIVNTATVASATPDPDSANDTATATTALNAAVVDLSVTKSNGVTTVTPGLATTYTITVSNGGPASAPNTRVVDQFDPAIFAGSSWECVATGTSICQTTGPQTGNIDTLINVDPGAGNVVTLTVQATVRADLAPPGDVVNTVTITPAAIVSDPNSANNTATDTDTITTDADVAVVKTGPTTVVPGSTVEYSIVVTNNGPSTAIDIQVGDVIFAPFGAAVFPQFLAGVVAPPGIACPEVLVTAGSGEEFPTPICLIPSLAPGASETFTWRFTIPPDFPGSPNPSTHALENVVNAFVPPDSDSDLSNNFDLVLMVVTPAADLSITKVGPASTLGDSGFSYTIHVENNGPSAAFNVQIDDLLPAGLLPTAVQGPCPTGFPCTVPVLNPGEAVDVRIDVIVLGGSGTIVNTATVQSDTPDPNAADNSASVSTLLVDSQADLALTKIGPSSVAPGGLITYDITLRNLGPSLANGVHMIDALPAGTTFVALTAPPLFTFCATPAVGASGVINCNTFFLDIAELTYRVTVRANDELLPGSVLSNVAVASAVTPDLNTTNDRAQVDTRVAAATEADLVITKSDAPDPVTVLGNVTYTLTVRNLGPAAATGVTLTDALPAGLTFVSATPSQGSCSPPTCTLGTLPAAGVATVTIVATAGAPGVVTNTASVFAAETDPVPANNSASEPTTIGNADQADLLVEKTGPAFAAPGQAMVYGIRVTNRGPAPAVAVQLLDPLPAGLQFFSNTGACTSNFPCDLETIPPGESRTVTTTVVIPPGFAAPATITNTATAQSSVTADPVPANNAGAVVTNVQPAATNDLAIVKTDSPDAVVGGALYGYTLTVVNRGPGVATGVVVADTLPPGVTEVVGTASQGACSGTGPITCTLGSMLPGSYAVIALSARAPLDLPVPNPMVNTATVGSAEPDFDPSNNAATQPTTVVVRADLQVTKTAPATATPGAEFLYTISVTNVGPSNAAGVVLTDVLPPGVTFVSASAPCAGGFPCAIGSLGPAGSAAITVTVKLDPAAVESTTIANTATVTTTTPDPVPSNDLSTAITVVGPPSADVAVVKLGPPVAVIGTNVTYTLQLSNAGPSTARDVVLSDVLSMPFALVSAGAPCASGFPCAIGTLAPGASHTITATFAVPPATDGTVPLVNTATIAASTADPNSANNASTVETPLITLVDVRLAKTVDNEAPMVGETVQVTVSASNAGPSAATGIVIAEQLPAGLRLLATTPSTGSFDVTTRQWSLGTLLPGASATLLVSAEVLLSGSQANIATVSSVNEADGDTSNNTAGAALNVPAAADLQVRKLASPTVAPVGSPTTFTVTVRNAGPDPATGVQILDTLPSGLTFVSSTPSIGAYDPSTGLWSLGTLAVGATATLQIGAQVAAAGALTNIAQVVASGVFDPTAANDAAGAIVNGVAADLQVLKAADRPQGLVGETITFTVTVSNLGPTRTTGVRVEDILPDGLAFGSASASIGTYDETSGLWTVGDLGAPGVAGETAPSSATLQIVATLVQRGAWDNRARVYSSELPDTNPLNDHATVTVGVSEEADLAVTKVADVPSVPVGGAAMFTVTVVNNGPHTATNVVLADVLSPGLAFVSASPGAGTFDAAIGRWSLPTIAPGASATLTLVAQATASGPQTNQVGVVASSQPDPNTANNTTGAALNVPVSADLQVSKEAERDLASVGAAVGFVVRVRNAGPDAATGVVVNEPLPPALTFVLATPSVGTYDAASGNWAVGTIAAGAEATLRIVALVVSPAPTTNLARIVSAGELDPAPVNGEATASINSASLDLAVAAAVVGPAPLLGDLATVRLTLSNNGPADATNVVMSALLTPGLRLIAASPSSGAFDRVTGVWRIDTLLRPGLGTPATLDLLVRVDAAFQSVTTTLSAIDQLDLVEPNNRTVLPIAGNQWSTFQTDLEVSAAVNVAAAVPGSQVTFTASSFNRGPTYAENVALAATLPAALTFVSAAPSAEGSCVTPAVGAPGTVTCQWPGIMLLQHDARRTVTIVATVDAGAAPGSTLTTSFATTATNGEYYPADNVRLVRLPVSGTTADLGVRVAVGNSTAPLAELHVRIGDPVSVRFVVSNTGGVAASGVFEVTSPDPSLLQIVGATISQGTGQPSAPFGGAWDVGALAPGASAELTLQVRLLSPQAAAITIARTTSSPGDTNRDNDAAAIALDGTGPQSGGRYTAAGNIDGLGGSEILVGGGFGETPLVRVFSGGGLETGIQFYAFDRRFVGGVRLAACDVDGDGRDEIVAGAGPGGGPHVRVLRVRGLEVAEIVGFYAFEPTFPGGVHVACSDLDRDGRQEVIVGADAGRAPEVRVFSLGPLRFDLVASWLAYEPGFTGGVRVGGTRLAPGAPFSVLTTPGPGRPADVRAWQPTGGTGGFVAELRADPAATLGITAHVADLDADGSLDLIVGAGEGLPSIVRAFSATNGQLVGEALLYPAPFLGGVRFSLGVLDGGPGVPEFIAAQGAGGEPRIQTYYLTGGGPVRRLDFLALEVP